MSDGKITLEAARITHRQTIIVAVLSAIAAISTAAFGSPIVRDWVETKLKINNVNAVKSPETAVSDVRSIPVHNSSVAAMPDERLATLREQIAVLKDREAVRERDLTALHSAYDSEKAKADLIERKNNDLEGRLSLLQQQKESSEITLAASSRQVDTLQRELDLARATVREFETTSKKGGTVELRRPEIFIAFAPTSGDAHECVGRAKTAGLIFGAPVQQRDTSMVMVNSGAYVAAVKCFADQSIAGFVALGPELARTIDNGDRLIKAFSTGR